jgi:hypothetical protein
MGIFDAVSLTNFNPYLSQQRSGIFQVHEADTSSSSWPLLGSWSSNEKQDSAMSVPVPASVTDQQQLARSVIPPASLTCAGAAGTPKY